jgi:hypothetical protein
MHPPAPLSHISSLITVECSELIRTTKTRTAEDGGPVKASPLPTPERRHGQSGPPFYRGSEVRSMVRNGKSRCRTILTLPPCRKFARSSMLCLTSHLTRRRRSLGSWPRSTAAFISPSKCSHPTTRPCPRLGKAIRIARHLPRHLFSTALHPGLGGARAYILCYRWTTNDGEYPRIRHRAEGIYTARPVLLLAG